MPTIWQDAYEFKAGISVPKIGIRVVHDPGYTIDRPHGFEMDYIFIHFTSRIEIFDATGTHIHQPGACILSIPGFRQWYRGVKTDFSHNWFHCRGPRAKKLITELKLPLNRIFYPSTTDFVEPIINDMVIEASRRDSHFQRALSNYSELFFVKLHRSLVERNKPLTARGYECFSRLKKLREQIAREPQKSWRLDEMAKSVSLSIPRLCVAYRESFGITPIEEVLQQRIQRAQLLLLQHEMSVKEVARNVGIEDPAYFSRIFSKRIGMSPLAFHNRHADY